MKVKFKRGRVDNCFDDPSTICGWVKDQVGEAVSMYTEAGTDYRDIEFLSSTMQEFNGLVRGIMFARLEIVK